MKKTIFACLIFLIPVFASAQKNVLRGVVRDTTNGEPLIGASVVVKGTTRGTITDLDGKYALELSKGNFDIVVSFVGYEPFETNVEIDGEQTLDVALSSDLMMKEVVVTADIAIDRKTPVAFSNINTLKIKEELASQDLPMLLNSMPGAYATQQGGGDGDARITIRGFNQRNVAVMLDGIPVNDMENGQVYWSNWFGLSLVTKTMQVQRGLGASKISIPSVGGTINIITKGLDSKASFDFKQEAGAGGMFQTTLGFTTGRLKKGFGVTGAFANRRNDGWVDQNYSQALFYFLRIDKEIGKKHMLSLIGFGGPQEHGQRPFSTPIAQTSLETAKDLGISDSVITVLRRNRGVDRGLKYSDSWGYLNGKPKNVRINYYHKPQFSLRHSWSISPKTFISNVAYLSVGNGGGTNVEGTITYDSTGQINLQRLYDENQRPFTARANIIRANVNNHFWYGLLSTMQHEFSKKWKLSAGLDLRYYKGEHYRTIYDMLGGRQFLGSRNARIDNGRTPLVKGDRYFYDYDGLVRWGGGFGMLEYTGKRWSAFLNVSSALSQYKYHDKMFAQVVYLNNDTLYTSYAARANDVLLRVPIVNGTMYTINKPSQAMYDYAKQNNLKIDSTTASDQILGWINLPSYTFKTGASFNLSRSSTVFFNAGYLSRATRFNNVFNAVYNGSADIGKIKTFYNFDNEKITAFEAGYQFRSPDFAANFNAYYTDWKNKPVENAPLITDPNDPNERIPAAISGIGARHMGIEIDFAWEFARRWKLEGLVSLGDWIWNSQGILTNPIDGSITVFDPVGVHVADAAQTQLGGALRFEPARGMYITARGTYFGKNYANFDPESLQGANARRESWKMPNYTIFDLHMGYRFAQKNGGEINLRGSVLNVLNAVYIADARNNDTQGNTIGTTRFDAASATVFYGLGRRWTLTMEVSF